MVVNIGNLSVTVPKHSFFGPSTMSGGIGGRRGKCREQGLLQYASDVYHS
jgi:hypothetical protein